MPAQPPWFIIVRAGKAAHFAGRVSSNVIRPKVPIVDVRFVQGHASLPASASAQHLADAIGQVLAPEPGRTWVRLQALEASHYAENGTTLTEQDLPVFVSLFLAHPPQGAEFEAQVVAVGRAVAQCFARAPQRVHVEYAPAAAGRMAFGGVVVR